MDLATEKRVEISTFSEKKCSEDVIAIDTDEESLSRIFKMFEDSENPIKFIEEIEGKSTIRV